VKAGQRARPKTIKGEVAKYLVAIHHPDDYDPSVAEDEAVDCDIDALNDEMIAAGVLVFVGGLHPVSSAKSLRAQPDGKMLITDRAYLETKEHVGAFLGARGRWPGRGAGVGAQGRRRLSRAGRARQVSLTLIRSVELNTS
jgi:hypothetical protein